MHDDCPLGNDERVHIKKLTGLARAFGLKNTGITGNLLQKYTPDIGESHQFQKYRRNWAFLQEIQEVVPGLITNRSRD